MSESIRRKAHLARHRCGRTVLVGLDANRCAMTATASVYPLSNFGEVEALRAGRWTYELSMGALDRRDRWTIAGRPASDTTVVASHDCDVPVPAAWVRPINRPAAPTKEDTTCPF
jgi:hypothetical protein